MTNTFKHDEMLDLHLFLTYIYLGFNINGQIGSKVVFVPHIFQSEHLQFSGGSSWYGQRSVQQFLNFRIGNQNGSGMQWNVEGK